MKKKKKKIPEIKTVKCKNCRKYVSGSWVECNGQRLHVETNRVCEEFDEKS